MIEHILSLKLMYINEKKWFCINFYWKNIAFSHRTQVYAFTQKKGSICKRTGAKNLISLCQTSKFMIEHISSFKLRSTNPKLCFCSKVFLKKIVHVSLIIQIFACTTDWLNGKAKWFKLINTTSLHMPVSNKTNLNFWSNVFLS